MGLWYTGLVKYLSNMHEFQFPWFSSIKGVYHQCKPNLNFHTTLTGSAWHLNFTAFIQSNTYISKVKVSDQSPINIISLRDGWWLVMTHSYSVHLQITNQRDFQLLQHLSLIYVNSLQCWIAEIIWKSFTLLNEVSVDWLSSCCRI